MPIKVHIFLTAKKNVSIYISSSDLESSLLISELVFLQQLGEVHYFFRLKKSSRSK